GGPGSGPVAVKKHLEPYLPVPTVGLEDRFYYLDYDRPKSIGKVKSFYGNFGVLVRAWAYIKTMGGNGLKEVTEMAVLNANYMLHKLSKYYEMPYGAEGMHEFVLSGKGLKKHGLITKDLAKIILDHGFHPPTVYFPLIVDEAIMIEPTETESVEEMDRFCTLLQDIAEGKGLKKDAPGFPNNYPEKTARGRLDEVKAAKDMILTYKAYKESQQKKV
ncbi:MAG: aminomethyl-transferring glycine dehydrogenase subunit GcvPB, partial [Thermoplasmata archaeon]